MKKNLKKSLSLGLLLAGGIAICSSTPNVQTKKVGDIEVLCETDSIEVIRKILVPAKDEYDVDKVSISLRNKFTGDEEYLFTTNPEVPGCWYAGDGDKFCEADIDSIPFVEIADVYRERPLQLILEGYDARNTYSYFIDVPSRKAWYIPANQGYMGPTEEGYMVFRSYRYVGLEYGAGRYTFIQVFDENGDMIDSLDLKHIRVEEFLKYNGGPEVWDDEEWEN